MDKANSYGRHLGCMLATEYSTMITQHQFDLELIVNEGEDTVATTENEECAVKQSSASNSNTKLANHRISRGMHMVKAKRRHHQN